MGLSQGFVAEGYGPVRDLFESYIRSGLEEHVQCSAFVDGVKVVELWASAVPSQVSPAAPCV